MHDWFPLLLGGDLNKFNVGLYTASICHSVFYFKDMADMDDDYLLVGYCHAWMISTAPGCRL